MYARFHNATRLSDGFLYVRYQGLAEHFSPDPTPVEDTFCPDAHRRIAKSFLFSFRHPILLKQIHDRVLESQLQVRLQLHAQFSIGTFADADFYGVIFRLNRISSRFL